MSLQSITSRCVNLGLTGAVATAGYYLFLRPWHLRWQATDQDVSQQWPGDELVPQPQQLSTRTVVIQAGAEEIWPWLAQLGQEKGGFYSYQWLENLFGCNIYNASRIIPAFQHLAVGEEVRLGPAGYPSYTVAQIEPPRVLVLQASQASNDGREMTESWAFYVVDVTPTLSRLIVRNRRQYGPALSKAIIWQLITEPIRFIMERKMLWGIKERVEAASPST